MKYKPGRRSSFRDLVKVAPQADLQELLDKLVLDGRAEKRIVNGIAQYRAIRPKIFECK